MHVEEGVRLCSLQYATSRVETCPGAGCPFWDEGGGALPGGCALERLGLDLKGRPGLVHALLQIRRKLDQATTPEDEAEARSLFYRLVPARNAD